MTDVLVPETTLTSPTMAMPADAAAPALAEKSGRGPIANIVLEPVEALCDPGMARLMAMVLSVAVTIVILWGLIALGQWIWNTFVNQAVTWSRPITMATALWLSVGILILIGIPAILSSLIIGLIAGAFVEDTKMEMRKRYPGLWHRLYSTILRGFSNM